MKNKELSVNYLSMFCLELSLLLKAGIRVADGLYILLEDEQEPYAKAKIQQLYQASDEGISLGQALNDCGCFPAYMCNLVTLAERAGRLEDTLAGLSHYYAQQGRLMSTIKNALVYPVILLSVMLAVVVILVTQVLPIFNQVFAQLGAQMSPVALALMGIGNALSSASTFLFALLVIVAIAVAVVLLVPSFKAKAIDGIYRNFGGTGIMGKLSTTRFAASMAMAMSSGFDGEEAMEMAGLVAGASKKMKEKLSLCQQLISQGERMEQALVQAQIFSARESRLLALGIKTGAGDVVMQEIARDSEEKLQNQIAALLAKVEPTMVILISLMVGAILLSVMLPLMGIMSTIG